MTEPPTAHGALGDDVLARQEGHRHLGRRGAAFHRNCTIETGYDSTIYYYKKQP